MKIKRSWRRAQARLLVRAAMLIMVLVGLIVMFEPKRIVGNELAPLYKDGDLVIRRRSDNAPFLQMRIRGFDD